MSQILRVLSIDFDVFALLPDTRYLTLYPDGIDLSTELSRIVWSSSYAHQRPDLDIHNITCNQEMLRDTLQLIHSGCTAQTPVMLANSHIHIYDWIFQHFNKTKHTGIMLTHLDMHHDFFNENPELDCGNWVSHVKDAVPKTKVEWVANPITKEMYGLDNPQFAQVLTSVKDLKPRKFDLVFICRSDPWLPPHLDIDFENFKQELLHFFDHLRIENCVNEPREIESLVSQLQTAYAQMKQFAERK